MCWPHSIESLTGANHSYISMHTATRAATECRNPTLVHTMIPTVCRPSNLTANWACPCSWLHSAEVLATQQLLEGQYTGHVERPGTMGGLPESTRGVLTSGLVQQGYQLSYTHCSKCRHVRVRTLRASHPLCADEVQMWAGVNINPTSKPCASTDTSGRLQQILVLCVPTMFGAIANRSGGGGPTRV